MKNVPNLRFKEFTDEWEEKSLSSLFERITEKNTENNDNVLTISAQYGLISQTDFFNKSVAGKDLTKYYLLHRDDFAYNKSYSNGYPMGAIKRLTKYDKGIVSTLYICFKKRNNDNVSFLEQFFESKKIEKSIQDIAQEGARNHGLLNIGVGDFFDITIKIPYFEEQKRIADFLSSIDKKISITEEKLSLFNEYKKGIMQKIFNQELRFKDENGNDYPEWEEKKLKDLTESISNGISLNQNFDGIGYKVTRIETISSGKINLEKVGYITTDKNIDEYKLNIGDLLFSNINSVEHIGKIAYIDKNYDLYHGMNLLRIVFNKNLCSKYLYYILTERKYKKLFEKLCNKAVSQASINQTELGKIKVYVPCLEEQQKIADFLSIIDTKIEKISDELENLKEFKKGLLQQMFV